MQKYILNNNNTYKLKLKTCLGLEHAGWVD
jgi:hypothetical protein